MANEAAWAVALGWTSAATAQVERTWIVRVGALWVETGLDYPAARFGIDGRIHGHTRSILTAAARWPECPLHAGPSSSPV